MALDSWNRKLQAASKAHKEGKPVWFSRANFARYSEKPKLHVFKDRTKVSDFGEFRWSALCGYTYTFKELFDPPRLITGRSTPPVRERCTKCDKKRAS